MIFPKYVDAVIESHRNAYGINEDIDLKWFNNNEKQQVCDLLSGALSGHQGILDSVKSSPSQSFVRIKIVRLQYSVAGQIGVNGTFTLCGIVMLRKIGNDNNSI
jgi:hypothetical protein